MERKGGRKKAKEIALALAEMGLTVEQIAKAVKINVDVVTQWLEEHKKLL